MFVLVNVVPSPMLRFPPIVNEATDAAAVPLNVKFLFIVVVAATVLMPLPLSVRLL